MGHIGLLPPFFSRMDMQVAVAQIPLLAKQQVLEGTLKIDGRIINPFRYITVVGTYQRIAEIPRMQGKLVVVDAESQTIDG